MEAEVSHIKEAQTRSFSSLATQQGQWNNQHTAALKKIEAQQEHEANRAHTQSVHVKKELEALLKGQKDVLAGQETQKQSLEILKAIIIKDIENKLETTTGAIKQACEAAKTRSQVNTDTYAARAAQNPPNDAPRYRPIPNYFNMAKKSGDHEAGSHANQRCIDTSVRQGLA